MTRKNRGLIIPHSVVRNASVDQDQCVLRAVSLRLGELDTKETLCHGSLGRWEHGASHRSSAQRLRISVDVAPEVRRRLRLAAAKRDVTVRQYVLEVIEEQLRQDLGDTVESELVLTAKTDPVLAQLWDNPKDAAYDDL